MNEIVAICMQTLLPIIGTVISGLASWGLIELNKYVRTRTKNESINDALSHVTHTVETTVKDLEQTMVKELKAASADGKLTRQDALSLKDVAVMRIKSQVPDAIQKAAALGVKSLGDLIEAKIEKTVLELKAHSA